MEFENKSLFFPQIKASNRQNKFVVFILLILNIIQKV